MSGLIFWLSVLALFYLVWKINRQGACVQCGGKGGHRPNCPRRHDLD